MKCLGLHPEIVFFFEYAQQYLWDYLIKNQFPKFPDQIRYTISWRNTLNIKPPSVTPSHLHDMFTLKE